MDFRCWGTRANSSSRILSSLAHPSGLRQKPPRQAKGVPISVYFRATVFPPWPTTLAGMPRAVRGSLFPLQKLKPSRIPRLSFNGANTFAKTFKPASKSQQSQTGSAGQRVLAMPTADKASGRCLAHHSNPYRRPRGAALFLFRSGQVHCRRPLRVSDSFPDRADFWRRRVSADAPVTFLFSSARVKQANSVPA